MRRALTIAVGECLRHPFRTLLVSQGILWAVALVVVPAAVIEGSRQRAVERAAELGTDLLQIEPDPSRGLEGAPRESDLATLRTLLPPDGALSAVRARPLTWVEDADTESAVWWVGTDAEHRAARGVELAVGRWFGEPGSSAIEIPPGAIEAVVEPDFAAAALPADPLGSRLRITWPAPDATTSPRLTVLAGSAAPEETILAEGEGGRVAELVVVGVLAPERSAIDRFGIEEGSGFATIIRQLMRTLGIAARPVPYLESGRGILVDRTELPGDTLDWIFLRGDAATISTTEERAEQLLIEAGRAPLIYSNAAWAILSQPELDGYFVIHDILFWVATGVGLVMLANLLLLAATHRRREIALRQAEGARRRVIFLQFLGESLVLAAIGIVLGVLVGMAIAKVRVAIDPNTLLTITWPWAAIVRGSLILLAGALVAAVGPAWRASRHHPVELIRRAAGGGGGLKIGRAGGILRHPGRSALLVTTYAFGFAAVLAAVGTIEGGRKSIREDATSLGVDVIAALNPIAVGPISIIGDEMASGERVDIAAIEALEEEFGDDVRAVIPLRMELGMVRGGTVRGGTLVGDEQRSVTTPVMATDHRFEGVLRAGMLAGTFFPADATFVDDPAAPLPAVIDEALARRFAPDDPAAMVGRTVELLREGRLRTANVVGVFRDPISLRKHMTAFDGQSKGRDVSARRLEFRNIYIPWGPSLPPSGVLVQTHDDADVERIVPRMKSTLEARGIAPFYHVQKTWVRFVLEIVDRFSTLSHFIWAVDLLMVIVLTATISLLSISERYPEVALRRAEGATRLRVVVPLLVEATWLGVLAMPLGVALGLAIVEWGIRPVLEWAPHYPPLALWGTPLTVLGAAWIAHLWPAVRIARLDPAPVLSQHTDVGN